MNRVHWWPDLLALRKHILRTKKREDTAMVRSLILVSVVALLTACVSGTITDHGNQIEALTGDADYDSTSDFDVQVDQATTPIAMPATTPGTIDVRYVITIENRTRSAAHLKRIDLQSVSGSLVQIDVSTRKFNKIIEPGAKTSVDYWATARIQDSQIGAKAPMIIRTRLHFDPTTGTDERREEFTRRVNGHLGVTIG